MFGGEEKTCYENKNPIISSLFICHFIKRKPDRDRCLDESQITGQLEHPSIVPLHDLGVDKDDTGVRVVKGSGLF